MPSPYIEPWRPSLAEYHHLADLGAFDDVKVEYLDGVITLMVPPSPEHDATIEYLTRLFVLATDPSFGVRVQSGVSIDERWEPQPDLAIVRSGAPRPWHPTAPLLVVEVAVSSLGRDRLVKRAVYARSGAPEYWIVNVGERCVEVHRDSDGEDFRSRTVVRDRVTCIALPQLTLDLDELWTFVFGPGGPDGTWPDGPPWRGRRPPPTDA